MVDNFEMVESKYGRIFKVAGPRKYSLVPHTASLSLTLNSPHSFFL